MGSEQAIDLPGYLHLAACEQDEVVGHPLELGSTCEDSTTDMPSAAASVTTVAMKSCRATGSSIATGSSSTSRLWPPGQRHGQRDLRRWPPDSFPAFRFSGMPSSASRACA